MLNIVRPQIVGLQIQQPDKTGKSLRRLRGGILEQVNSCINRNALQATQVK
jgi:hypothetical protein